MELLLFFSIVLNCFLAWYLRDARRRLEIVKTSRAEHIAQGEEYYGWYKEAAKKLGEASRDATDLRNRLQAIGKITSAAALVLVGLFASSSHAQQVSPPPEDGGRAWLVVLTHDQPSPQERYLLDTIERDENLAAIRRQCHFTHYTASNPLYRERYSKSFGPERLPVVLLQRADGGVLYLASGSNIPDSGRELFDQMRYYSSLDPTRGNGDSITHYGSPGGSIYTQCPRCPPDRPDCDGGTCPLVPGVPSLDPFAPPGGGMAMPDSSALLRRPQESVDVQTIGLCLLVVGILLGLGALGLLALVAFGWFAFRPPAAPSTPS